MIIDYVNDLVSLIASIMLIIWKLIIMPQKTKYNITAQKGLQPKCLKVLFYVNGLFFMLKFNGVYMIE